MNNIFYNAPYFLFVVYIFVLGLCIGSFLNVAILRGLKNEPIVFARSKCPTCNNQLKWYMNIPLISFIFLKGKCAFCKTPISFQYPIIELITGLLFVLAFFVFGLTLKTLFVCIIFALFILMTTTDIKETVIIDYHAYILLAVGIIASYFKIFDINMIQSILGALFGFIAFESLSRIGYIFCNQRMFGFGDSLIVLALGAIFGFKNLLILIPLSFLIQMFSAIPILVINAFKEHNKKLAFSYILVFVLIPSIFLINKITSEYKIIATILISIVLLISLREILAEIKEKKEQLKDIENDDEQFEKSPFCLLPFGPGLIISAFICLFYIDKIKAVVYNFFF